MDYAEEEERWMVTTRHSCVTMRRMSWRHYCNSTLLWRHFGNVQIVTHNTTTKKKSGDNKKRRIKTYFRIFILRPKPLRWTAFFYIYNFIRSLAPILRIDFEISIEKNVDKPNLRGKKKKRDQHSIIRTTKNRTIPLYRWLGLRQSAPIHRNKAHQSLQFNHDN